MGKQKISVDDFNQNSGLSAHSRNSKEVARALDTHADSLPFARVLTSYEFEDFLSLLTQIRRRLWSKGLPLCLGGQS